MAGYYDKDKLKESLEPEQVFDLLEDFGGNPTWENNAIISDTICHNPPQEGSHKLYYYFANKMFYCYSGCVDPSFDIFELVIKVMKIQKGLKWELYDAMSYVAQFFGFQGIEPQREKNELPDWTLFNKYDYDASKSQFTFNQLKEYNPVILTRFAYPRIISWEQEGINKEVCRNNLIGYYAGDEQITIPHFDMNGRLVGVRGRFLSEEDSKRKGKYRPLLIGDTLYNHPLSMNLYNLNNSKDNIAACGAAIILESEKSTLQFQSFYGKENDISVACCGSSISNYQIQLLRHIGAKEIVIALDRQFQEIGDEEFKRLTGKLTRMNNKYKNEIKISIIFDKNMITPYKASPTDCGKEVFEKLLKERLYL